MVWLFNRYEAMPKQSKETTPEFLSDHPTDAQRISDLETLFRNDPANFGRFSADPSAATPLPALRQYGPAPAQQSGPPVPPQAPANVPPK
jgi:predicted Zn-dependent protease